MLDFQSIRERAQDAVVMELDLAGLMDLPLDQQMCQPVEVRQRLAVEMRRRAEQSQRLADFYAEQQRAALERLLAR